MIAIGGGVQPLLKQAKQIAAKIGKVEIEMGDTACRWPRNPFPKSKRRVGSGRNGPRSSVNGTAWKTTMAEMCRESTLQLKPTFNFGPPDKLMFLDFRETQV